MELPNHKTMPNKLHYLVQWQRAIKICFNNVSINFLTKRSSLQKELSENDEKLMPHFQVLYDLIYQLYNLDQDTSAIYNTYSECVEQCFSKMAKSLSKILNNPAEMSSLHVAKKLIEYWQNVQQNVLPFLIRVLMHTEWQQLTTTSNMLLEELTAKLFVQNILNHKSFQNVSDYVTKMITLCIIQKCNQIGQYLLKNKSVLKSDLLEFKRLLINEDEMEVCRLMIQMLTSLGYNSNWVYYSLFEVSFLQKDYPKFQSKLSDNSLKSLSVLAYIEFISKYIELQSFLFSSLGFPQESMKDMQKFSVYFLLTKNFKHLIDNEENNGFKQLMDERKYESIKKFYSLIYDQYKTITMFGKSADLLPIKEFKLFIQQYLNNHLNRFGSLYYCRNRHEAIEFVKQLIDEHEHWFFVCKSIFQNGPDFKPLIQNYFYKLLKINEHVCQSLAYFMHELLSINSDLLKMFQTETKKIELDELLGKLFNILVYVNKMDINQFYDFTKHYFTVRLLTGSSFLSTDHELEQLNRMNTVIKSKFLNDEFENLIQYNFRNIYNDYLNSDRYYSNVFVKKKSLSGNMLKKFSIIHAGLWKLADFEQCWIPIELQRSFQEFEKYFRKEHKDKKLLLNTKYCHADVIYKLSNNKELKLVMNLNQLAILNQFNKNDKVNYEMLLQATNFKNDSNLRNALLSLIYCGLIRCSRIGSDMENVIFELNENVFAKLIKRKKVSEELCIYEQINFLKQKPLDWNLTSKQFNAIVQVLSPGQDLPFKMSAISVDTTSEKFKIENNKLNRIDSSTKRIDDKKRMPDEQSLPIVIQAAIIRILKRVTHLTNLASVHKAVQKEIQNRRLHLTKASLPAYCINENDISLDDVQFALDRLIDGKYVERDGDSFIYLID